MDEYKDIRINSLLLLQLENTAHLYIDITTIIIVLSKIEK
jgi:hypothetical protein